MARKVWRRRGVVSLGSDAFVLKNKPLSALSEFHTWRSMLARCYSRKNKNFKNYGGRGIKVNKEWFNFETFYNDMGERPSNKYSIERINNNDNYKKENCMWAIKKIQCINKRNNSYIEYNGKRKTISEWSELLGIKQNTLLYKRKRGLTDEEIISGVNKTKEKKESRKRVCIICSKVFYPRKSQLEKGMGLYCSHKCHYANKKIGKDGRFK